ncbi:uncharacterized protein LOC126265671 [Aethina tumida]|uniref:uncharacterized protein LOC126265671 n=1 Tax=Aethina tumida TaxID=116153 RepID=UPI0021474F4D|nr:uncharacterized protein LOC126265671 [Aethina tumida]
MCPRCKMCLVTILAVIFLISGAACNTTIQDLITFNSKITFDNVSPECTAAIGALGERIIFILDANAKIPSGILNSNFYDAGSYDECYQLETGVEDLYGKYCMGHVPLSVPSEYKEVIQRDSLELVLKLGYCLPSACTSEDFNKVYFWANFDEDLCATKAVVQEYDASDILAITIFSIIGGLVVLCTSYDVYLYYADKSKCPNNSVSTKLMI